MLNSPLLEGNHNGQGCLELHVCLAAGLLLTGEGFLVLGTQFPRV